MEKNQIRQNKATKEWVIYATDRGERPKDFKKKENEKRTKIPRHDDNCPFCPGNEHKLESIITEVRGKNSKLWQIRVVPNKYPALLHKGYPGREIEDIYITMKSYGRHEVIIESPYHNSDISDMSNEEVELLFDTYQKRYLDVMKEHINMIPIIFRNHGKRAGTSLLHPHSQLIVTGFVPHHIRWREIESQRYYDEWGRCVFCDILNYEIEKKIRIIAESGSMVSFVPFAAEVPFEVWIMPKKHQADFGLITAEEKKDISRMLRNILSVFYEKLDDPDYNYIINTSARFEAGEPHLHWYLQIRPRLTTKAGFEIGSGISINPSLPEDDALFLKS